MSRLLLEHLDESAERGAVFAALEGHESPLPTASRAPAQSVTVALSTTPLSITPSESRLNGLECLLGDATGRALEPPASTGSAGPRHH